MSCGELANFPVFIFLFKILQHIVQRDAVRVPLLLFGCPLSFMDVLGDNEARRDLPHTD